jgi:hypothetical protein
MVVAFRRQKTHHTRSLVQLANFRAEKRTEMFARLQHNNDNKALLGLPPEEALNGQRDAGVLLAVFSDANRRSSGAGRTATLDGTDARELGRLVGHEERRQLGLVVGPLQTLDSHGAARRRRPNWTDGAPTTDRTAARAQRQSVGSREIELAARCCDSGAGRLLLGLTFVGMSSFCLGHASMSGGSDETRRNRQPAASTDQPYATATRAEAPGY